jgi:hypothetical protein
MYEQLRAAGFGGVRAKHGAAIDSTSDYWARQRERYVLQMAEALEEVRNGTAVVCFADQSFVHESHRRTVTIVDKTDRKQVVEQRKAAPHARLQANDNNKGRLLMIMHAIVLDEKSCGWLAPTDADGRTRPAEPPGEWTHHFVPHAENVRVSGKQPSDDYHTHFDSAMMHKWLAEQFWPAIWTKYGYDKKVYLALDNSKNQSARRADYVPPTATKAKLVSKLLSHGVASVSVMRQTAYWADVESGECDDRRNPKRRVKPPVVTRKQFFRDQLSDVAVREENLTADELKGAIRDLYKRQPELTISEVELMFANGGPDPVPNKRGPFPDGVVVKQHFEQEVKRKEGFHRLIRTPPYHSEANPIERCGAVCKQYVKKHSYHGRTLSEVRSDLLKGMYGDYGYEPGGGIEPESHRGVTPALCQRFVDSMVGTLNEWIGSHPRLMALFGAKTAVGKRTIAHLTAQMRAAYGPTVPIHKAPTGRKKPDPGSAGASPAP